MAKIGLAAWLGKIFAPLASRQLGGIEPVVKLFQGLKLPTPRSMIVSAIRKSEAAAQLAELGRLAEEKLPFPESGMIEESWLGTHRYAVQFKVQIARKGGGEPLEEVRRVYFENNAGIEAWIDRYMEKAGPGYEKYGDRLLSAKVDLVFHNEKRSY